MNTRYSGIYQTKSPLLNEALPSKITEVDQNTSHMSYADSYYLGDRKSFYSSFNSTLKRSSVMGGNSGRQITVKDTTNVKRNNYLTPNFRCQQLRADFQNNNQKNKVIDHRTAQNLNTDKCRTDYYQNCKQNCKLKLQQSQMYPNNNILTNIEDIDERQDATQSELKVLNEKQSFQKKSRHQRLKSLFVKLNQICSDSAKRDHLNCSLHRAIIRTASVLTRASL